LIILKLKKIAATILALSLFFAPCGCVGQSELPGESVAYTSLVQSESTTISETEISTTTSTSDTTSTTSTTEITYSKEILENPENVIVGGIEYRIETTREIYLDNTQGTSSFQKNHKLNDEDIENIAKLKNLREIHIANNNVTDISFVSELPELIYLDVSQNPISELHLPPYLEYLDVSYTEISELQVTRTLRHLDIGGTNITDITSLNACPDLEEISFSSNEIIDFTPLFNLKNLKGLTLLNTVIPDDQELGIRELKNLESFVFSSYKSGFKCSVISELYELRKLAIDTETGLDFDSLSGLTKLESLSLGGDNNSVEDAKFLENMKNLEYLSVHGVSDLKYIGGLTALKSLSFDPLGYPTDITPIENLINLETLYLSKVSVESFDPIYKLPKLRKLTLFMSRDETMDFPITRTEYFVK
jgi:hypothetical protein